MEQILQDCLWEIEDEVQIARDEVLSSFSSHISPHMTSPITLTSVAICFSPSIVLAGTRCGMLLGWNGNVSQVAAVEAGKSSSHSSQPNMNISSPALKMNFASHSDDPPPDTNYMSDDAEHVKADPLADISLADMPVPPHPPLFTATSSHGTISSLAIIPPSSQVPFSLLVLLTNAGIFGYALPDILLAAARATSPYLSSSSGSSSPSMPPHSPRPTFRLDTLPLAFLANLPRTKLAMGGFTPVPLMYSMSIISHLPAFPLSLIAILVTAGSDGRLYHWELTSTPSTSSSATSLVLTSPHEQHVDVSVLKSHSFTITLCDSLKAHDAPIYSLSSISTATPTSSYTPSSLSTLTSSHQLTPSLTCPVNHTIFAASADGTISSWLLSFCPPPTTLSPTLASISSPSTSTLTRLGTFNPLSATFDYVAPTPSPLSSTSATSSSSTPMPTSTLRDSSLSSDRRPSIPLLTSFTSSSSSSSTSSSSSSSSSSSPPFLASPYTLIHDPETDLFLADPPVYPTAVFGAPINRSHVSTYLHDSDPTGIPSSLPSSSTSSKSISTFPSASDLSPFTALCIDAQGQSLIAGTASGMLYIIYLRSRLTETVSLPAPVEAVVRACGVIIVALTDGSIAHVSRTGRILYIAKVHPSLVRSLVAVPLNEPTTILSNIESNMIDPSKVEPGSLLPQSMASSHDLDGGGFVIAGVGPVLMLYSSASVSYTLTCE